jgi:hypothetical protein
MVGAGADRPTDLRRRAVGDVCVSESAAPRCGSCGNCSRTGGSRVQGSTTCGVGANRSPIGRIGHGVAPFGVGLEVCDSAGDVGNDRPVSGEVARAVVQLGKGVEVAGDGDSVHDCVVVERTMYDKDSLPADPWRNTGPETLVLITCGGEFNRSNRRHEQNIVVYAVPNRDVDDPPQFIDPSPLRSIGTAPPTIPE